MECVSRYRSVWLLAIVPIALARAAAATPEPQEGPKQKALIEVEDRTDLLAAPRKDAAVIQALEPGAHLVLITHKKREGYYRVIRLDQGPVAWVDSAAVKIAREKQDADPERNKTCAESLDECPQHGCASAEEPEGILNQLKRRAPEQAVPQALTVQDFRTLQRIADERVGQGYPGLDRTQHAKLSELNVEGATVSEGTVVRTFGYLAKGGDGLHINEHGESVNCNLKSKLDNDFHIPLVAAADDSEFKSIVVEMIPQERPESWTVDALKAVQENGYQVWVEGPLLYDKTHYVSDDPDNPLDYDPNRMSLWEIHPVTRFLVCRKASCDRANERDWESL